MATHIYLDDIRPAPDGWTLVKDFDECVAALQNGCDYLSLDHDLAEEHYVESTGYMGQPVYRERTGYDVCLWMVQNQVWPRISITLHTANPVGRRAMRQLLVRHKPEHVQLFG